MAPALPLQYGVRDARNSRRTAYGVHGPFCRIVPSTAPSSSVSAREPAVARAPRRVWNPLAAARRVGTMFRIVRIVLWPVAATRGRLRPTTPEGTTMRRTLLALLLVGGLHPE